MSVFCIDDYSGNLMRKPQELVPAPFKNRPLYVRKFMCAIYYLQDSLGLTAKGVRILQTIIALGLKSESPEQPIYAKKSTIAKKSDTSEASVYRTLKILSSAGWLHRENQVQKIDGSMAITRIQFSTVFCQKMAEYIASYESSKESKKPIPKPIQEEKTDGLTDGLTDAPYIGELKSISNGKQKSSIGDQSDHTESVRHEGYSVPSKLFWLVKEKVLSATQIFCLMKKSKAVDGQKLEDYIELRKERLLELKTTNDRFRYINSLIRLKVDAKFLCQERNKKLEIDRSQIEKEKEIQKRISWLADKDRMTFVDISNGLEYFVIANKCAAYEQKENMKGRLIVIDDKFITQIKNGNIVNKNNVNNDKLLKLTTSHFDAMKSLLKKVRPQASSDMQDRDSQ